MFLSVDIGGTNTRIAISSDRKNISKKQRYMTPQHYDDALDKLVYEILEMTDGDIPEKISLGVPSPVDQIRGVILKPPALPGWAGQPIRKELEQRLKRKVLMENDTALAGLAEAYFGNRRKKYMVVGYVTFSTGIGGARIDDGQIDHKKLGFEPGHQILDPNGRFWPGCGQKGCLEAIGSGTAFEMTYGVRAENCEDERIWDEHAKNISQGLVNVLALWSPDVLVIGGSLIKAGKKFTDPLIDYTKSTLQIFEAPPIEISKMDDDNVLIGGMLLQKD